MSTKTFLFAVLLLSILSINSIFTNQAFSKNTKSEAIGKGSILNLVTYERVLIDGVWWIIVYDDDGSIINKYEDPIQE